MKLLISKITTLTFLGVEIGNISSNSAVRTCSFSYSADLASYSTDQAMKQECEIFIVDARDDESFSKFQLISIHISNSKIVVYFII